MAGGEEMEFRVNVRVNQFPTEPHVADEACGGETSV
jgi:hypothetical protein